MVTIEQGKIIFGGVEWNHCIEQLPNDNNSTSGCLLDTYSNEEFGKFALLYVKLEEIEINSINHIKLLELIHEKWLNNNPLIIFGDHKYRQLCTEWNNSSNTVCIKDELEILLV